MIKQYCITASLFTLLTIASTNIYASGQNTVIQTIQRKSKCFQYNFSPNNQLIIIPNKDQIETVLNHFDPELVEYCFTTAPKKHEAKPIKRYISWLATIKAHNDLSHNPIEDITELKPTITDMLYFLFGPVGGRSLSLQSISYSKELDTIFGNNLMLLQKEINTIKKQAEESNNSSSREIIYPTYQLNIPIPPFAQYLSAIIRHNITWPPTFFGIIKSNIFLSRFFNWKNNE